MVLKYGGLFHGFTLIQLDSDWARQAWHRASDFLEKEDEYWMIHFAVPRKYIFLGDLSR